MTYKQRSWKCAVSFWLYQDKVRKNQQFFHLVSRGFSMYLFWHRNPLVSWKPLNSIHRLPDATKYKFGPGSHCYYFVLRCIVSGWFTQSTIPLTNVCTAFPLKWEGSSSVCMCDQHAGCVRAKLASHHSVDYAFTLWCCLTHFDVAWLTDVSVP